MNRSLRTIMVVFSFLTMIFVGGLAHAEIQCHFSRHSVSAHTHHFDRFHPLNAHLKLQRTPRSASHHHNDGSLLAREALPPEQDPNSGQQTTVAINLSDRDHLVAPGLIIGRSQSWAARQNRNLYTLKSCYLI